MAKKHDDKYSTKDNLYFTALQRVKIMYLCQMVYLQDNF